MSVDKLKTIIAEICVGTMTLFPLLKILGVISCPWKYIFVPLLLNILINTVISFIENIKEK